MGIPPDWIRSISLMSRPGLGNTHIPKYIPSQTIGFPNSLLEPCMRSHEPHVVSGIQLQRTPKLSTLRYLGIQARSAPLTTYMQVLGNLDAGPTAESSFFMDFFPSLCICLRFVDWHEAGYSTQEELGQSVTRVQYPGKNCANRNSVNVPEKFFDKSPTRLVYPRHFETNHNSATVPGGNFSTNRNSVNVPETFLDKPQLG